MTPIPGREPVNAQGTRRACYALTRRGLPCRAVPIKSGDFCVTHQRLDVGVICWGGPLDGLPLRPPRNAPLVPVVAAVRDPALGILTYRRARADHDAVAVGWYMLTDARAGLWRHGLRYQWRMRTGAP